MVYLFLIRIQSGMHVFKVEGRLPSDGAGLNEARGVALDEVLWLESAASIFCSKYIKDWRLIMINWRKHIAKLMEDSRLGSWTESAQTTTQLKL
mmetsp:Transcript_2394/g.5528  ORF Transcript_2394/g.5528 Transcript_2394/m.5528 type:complete len:94 (-) Transcript_2394:278-559(-)